tara:strand:- start:5182 stop:5658 length:477 start_codon:yes stop_codon:yes gene_type:complete
MKQINFDDPWLKKNIENPQHEIYNVSNQWTYLQQFLQNIDFSYNAMIRQDIKKKHASYKSQDKKKNRYDESQHISYDELLEKLVDSRLKCYYCQEDLILIYKNKNEKKQWSLERFNNLLGHYATNTCISCLKCNLQRRNENHEYFKQSKQMKIVKTDS